MKTLYYISKNAIYGSLFFDENGPVSYIHENDGHWDKEYFGFIPKYFGGKIKYVDLKLTEELEEQLEDLDSSEKIWNILGPILLKAIK